MWHFAFLGMQKAHLYRKGAWGLVLLNRDSAVPCTLFALQQQGLQQLLFQPCQGSLWVAQYLALQAVLTSRPSVPAVELHHLERVLAVQEAGQLGPSWGVLEGA